MADVQRYLETLAADVRGVLRRDGDLDDAAQVAAQSERGRWQLFDEYNARRACLTKVARALIPTFSQAWASFCQCAQSVNQIGFV